MSDGLDSRRAHRPPRRPHRTPTEQMNAFLLPPGAVVLALGWRCERAAGRITYFDSQLLSALDHVREGERSVRKDV